MLPIVVVQQDRYRRKDMQGELHPPYPLMRNCDCIVGLDDESTSVYVAQSSSEFGPELLHTMNFIQ